MLAKGERVDHAGLAVVEHDAHRTGVDEQPVAGVAVGVPGRSFARIEGRLIHLADGVVVEAPVLAVNLDQPAVSGEDVSGLKDLHAGNQVIADGIPFGRYALPITLGTFESSTGGPLRSLISPSFHLNWNQSLNRRRLSSHAATAPASVLPWTQKA
jgi:hypothetical protein